MTTAEQIRQEERERQEQRFRQVLERCRGSLHAILADRGLPVSDVVRARIDRCDDIDQITTWLRRAATAGSATAILEQTT